MRPKEWISVTVVMVLIAITMVMMKGCSAIENASMLNKSGCKSSSSCICEPCTNTKIGLTKELR